MTLVELARWAHDRQRFDECVWVGRDVSIADVKAAVRKLLDDPSPRTTFAVLDEAGRGGRRR